MGNEWVYEIELYELLTPALIRRNKKEDCERVFMWIVTKAITASAAPEYAPLPVRDSMKAMSTTATATDSFMQA